eukprot:353864-Chlamydomonas_euryale.AAC.4
MACYFLALPIAGCTSCYCPGQIACSMLYAAAQPHQQRTSHTRALKDVLMCCHATKNQTLAASTNCHLPCLTAQSSKFVNVA